MAHAEHKHSMARVYLTVFGWLFILSTTAYLIDLIAGYRHWSLAVTAPFFTIIALMKVGLIAAYFMHLRYERLNLVYACITPLILAAVLFFALLPDAKELFMLR